MKAFIASVVLTLVFTGIYLYKDELPAVEVPALQSTIPNGVTTDYDCYVFSVQWGRTMCIGAANSCLEKLKKIPKNTLSIHGLWPSYRSGAKIPECNTGASVPIKDDGTSPFPDMRQYWPSLTAKGNEVFWGHEYNKHGYCYSAVIQDYDYKKYFGKAIELYNNLDISNLIVKAVGKNVGDFSISYEDLFRRLAKVLGGNFFSFTCKSSGGKQFLQEVRIGLSTSFGLTQFSLGGNCSRKKPIYIIFQS